MSKHKSGLKQGDIVYLLSGSLPMMVAETPQGEEKLQLMWMSNGVIYRDVLDAGLVTNVRMLMSNMEDWP